MGGEPVNLMDVPVIAGDPIKLAEIHRHNLTLAALESLSGIPTQRVTSIQQWDELEERLGVLMGPT